LPQRPLKFEISTWSIGKVLLAAAAVWAWLRLWEFLVALVVSIFLAVTFVPFARWLERRGMARWLASLFPVLLLVAVIVGFSAAAGSSIAGQAGVVGGSLTNAAHRLRTAVPAFAPVLNQIHSQSNTPEMGRTLALMFVSAGRALLLIAVGLILTVYLLIEREITLQWVISFVPKQHRRKMRETLSEVATVVSAYILGNLLTAACATVLVFITLTALRVPAGLLLALLAGLFDFVPIIGFIISGLPAVLLAITVSKSAAITVVIVYVCYHFAETYLIAPRIYGNRLRLSNVAVLAAFAAGAELGGVIGVVLALPFAATYPIVEKYWLAEYLGGDVADQHQRLMEETAKEPEIPTRAAPAKV
jgi:predicted PurR-regulated permease PerM